MTRRQDRPFDAGPGWPSVVFVAVALAVVCGLAARGVLALLLWVAGK